MKRGDGILSGSGAAIVQTRFDCRQWGRHEVDAVLFPSGMQVTPPTEEEQEQQDENPPTNEEGTPLPTVPATTPTPSTPMGIGAPPNPTFVLLTVPRLNPAFVSGRYIPLSVWHSSRQ